MDDMILDNLFLDDNANFVSVGNFLNLLWEAYTKSTYWNVESMRKEAEQEKGQVEETIENAKLSDSSLFRYAKKQGWIEEQDILNSNLPLQRRDLARIVHEFLRKELKEDDVQNISVANRLVDLFDCRVCVQHVAQVYLKGIIKSKQIQYTNQDEMTIFGMRDGIEQDEMEDIIKQIFHVQSRILIK